MASCQVLLSHWLMRSLFGFFSFFFFLFSQLIGPSPSGLASPRDRDSTAPATKPAEATSPALPANAASHFAEESPPKPADKREQYFEKEEPKPNRPSSSVITPSTTGGKTDALLEDKAASKPRKAGRKKPAASAAGSKGKKGEVSEEPLIRFEAIPVDETDRKKATADIRDLQLLEPSDPTQTWEMAFARSLSDDVYAGYSKLLGFARELNAGVVPFTEFVMIGFVGSGKSSLVEVLFGQPFNVVGVGSTKRPIFFQWVNNRAHSSVKVTVKRDPGQAEFDRDVEVALASLEMELGRRMALESESPIYVTFESADTLNFTMIDTPGLGQTGAIDAKVKDLAAVPHRHIIAVQVAVPEPNNELLAYLSDLDPDLSRTTIVYSNMFDMLKSVQDAESLGRFFSRTPEDSHKFFTSLPFLAERQALQSRPEYCEIVFKMHHRDLQSLEKLQYDTSFAPSIGALQLRNWAKNQVWRRFQQFVPALMQTARERVASSQVDLQTIRQQMDSFKGAKLRSLASNYTTEFLQAVSSLLAGTAEGNAMINGETLAEEKKGHGDAVWRTANNLPVQWKGDLNVPLEGEKLYGGQQLERLLAEFQVVANRAEIAEPSLADVANAAGINKLSSSTDVSWSAADLAQHKSKDAFVPLIRGLASRAAYVMKRAGDIARRMMETRRRNAEVFGASSIEDVNDATKYVSFRHFVSDTYNSFIDQQTQILVQKCMDEFYSTRTVHYSLSEEAQAATGGADVDLSNPDQLRETVVSMSRHIFGRLRSRITKQTLLKVYNFLLVPMQGALWSALQSSVSSLSDADLQKKFEVTSTMQRLQSAERSVLETIENTKTLQVDVQRAAASFVNVL